MVAAEGALLCDKAVRVYPNFVRCDECLRIRPVLTLMRGSIATLGTQRPSSVR